MTCPGGTQEEVNVNWMSETLGVKEDDAVERSILYRRYLVPLVTAEISVVVEL
jgi:hypothetical protein